MLPALIVKIVKHNWRTLYNVLAFLFLAVKNPKRVFLKSRTAVITHAVYIASYIFFKRCVIFCPAFGTSETVYSERNIVYSEPFKKLIRNGNNLRVKGRAI